GQVSWLPDRPTPRAFPAHRPVALAGFVPGHSDGVAADSHRLPWALVGTLGAHNDGTVSERARPRKVGRAQNSTRAPRWTTGSGGMPKKSVAELALRDMNGGLVPMSP